MKKNILAFIGWVLFAITGSALADAQNSKATTYLVPEVKVEKKPLPPEKKCYWVGKKDDTDHRPVTYNMAPLFVQTCHQAVYVPGTFYNAPGQTVGSVSLEEVCN